MGWGRSELKTLVSVFSDREGLSPIEAALRYLQLCREHPDTASLPAIRAHIRHFLDARRRDWFKSFRCVLRAIC